MFRRTLNVVFRPMKNNYVLLPDNYYRIVSTYENGCINLSYGTSSQYVSWAPYTSTLSDSEIGMNSSVAELFGLKEGMSIRCSVVSEVISLYSLNVSTTCLKDWEVLELSSNRIQETMLDQTRVVCRGQKILVWINKSMYITLKINNLRPNVPFGKLENHTELIVEPFITKPSTIKNGIENNNQTLAKQSSITEIAKLKQTTTEIIKKSSKITPKELAIKNLQIQLLEDLYKILKKETPSIHEFRVINGKWECGQICDIYLNRSNLPENFDLNQSYILQTRENQEFYVNVKVLGENVIFPKNIYPSIEINEILLNSLDVEICDRITLRSKRTVLNLVDRIELTPSKASTYKDVKDIEIKFKQYIIENAKLFPILINQNQIFKLSPNTFVTVGIFPETLRYCLIDTEILRECNITCCDQLKNLDGILKSNREPEQLNGVGHDEVKLEKYETIIQKLIERLKINLCLDERNAFRKTENLILIGNKNAGKTTMYMKILNELALPPFFCYFDIFYCSRNKGRKPESIQKDLRQILINCLNYSPSILVLDNLDNLTQHVAEQTQDGEYFNRVSDVIQSLIQEFTKDGSISILATVSNISNLNKRIFKARGRHLFQHVVQIPGLEKSDREIIIRDLCSKCKIGKSLNLKKFSNLTEGYNIGDLTQFVERAIFYAYRNDSTAPMLTDDIFNDSLQKTNSYCLQGIENNNVAIDESEIDVNEIAGMEDVVEVLEEVLMWPSKFPNIFSNSPLRNQAGVLLFGAPGTGKTYLVSQIAKTWNLRMISVKGPELLAKYIGQSEENVRNLFNRARSAKPCVLFFDEFDSLAPRRGHDSTGVTDRVVNQLLTELDGVEGLQGVTVIAATSRPELLDPALLRSGRLDRLVECSLPDKIARKKIFVNLSESLNLHKTVNFGVYAERSKNYTGADIQSILTSANMIAVKECIEKDTENIPDKILITQNHLEDAFNSTRPSLSQQDINKYALTYARFTNKEKAPRDFVAKRATLA